LKTRSANRRSRSSDRVSFHSDASLIGPIVEELGFVRFSHYSKNRLLLRLEDKGDSSIFAEICVIPRQLWQSEEKNNHCDLIFLVQTLSDFTLFV